MPLQCIVHTLVLLLTEDTHWNTQISSSEKPWILLNWLFVSATMHLLPCCVSFFYLHTVSVFLFFSFLTFILPLCLGSHSLPSLPPPQWQFSTSSYNSLSHLSVLYFSFSAHFSLQLFGKLSYSTFCCFILRALTWETIDIHRKVLTFVSPSSLAFEPKWIEKFFSGHLITFSAARSIHYSESLIHYLILLYL